MPKKPSASPAPAPPAPRLCPTCGTRVGEAATKCLVCGTDLTAGAPKKAAAPPAAPAPISVPRISLPLPVAIAGVVALVGIGLLLIFGARSAAVLFATPTPTITPTPTLTPTFTPRPTATEVPPPTPTPLPPLDYTVQAGDTVIGLAVRYNVSVQSILDANGLRTGDNIIVGQPLKIPQPTPTATEPPTATPLPAQMTEAARPRHTVAAGETLLALANFYKVDFYALMEVNGISNPDSVREGQVLVIPIDRPLTTAGPTPTPTPLPPYAAPPLLSPPDGAAFTAEQNAVTLQWSSVGLLAENEAYFVVVEDVTAASAKVHKATTQSTRYILPADMKPVEAVPHVFKWSVVTVRQVGANEAGTPIYEPAGATSALRTFTWLGSAAPAATPTPPG